MMMVPKNFGIRNQTIGDFFSLRLGKRFRGVVSSDLLRGLIRPDDTNFSVIVNLADSTQELGHFVSLNRRGNRLLYFDPIGIKCFVPDVLEFLESTRAKIRYNTHRFQNFTSQFCGLYAGVHLYLSSLNISLNQQRAMFPFTNDLNDFLLFEFVTKYLK